MALVRRPKPPSRPHIVARSSEIPECPTCGKHQVFIPTDQHYELGSLVDLTVKGDAGTTVFHRVVRVIARRTKTGAGNTLGAGVVVDVEVGAPASADTTHPPKERPAA